MSELERRYYEALEKIASMCVEAETEPLALKHGMSLPLLSTWKVREVLDSVGPLEYIDYNVRANY